jgi:hypothetical protein
MFKLPDHISQKYNEARGELEARKLVFASLSNTDLLISAKFWQMHCKTPPQFAPEDNVYDSTFWHIILPEIVKRLEIEVLAETRNARLVTLLEDCLLALGVLHTVLQASKMTLGAERARGMMEQIRSEICHV